MNKADWIEGNATVAISSISDDTGTSVVDFITQDKSHFSFFIYFNFFIIVLIVCFVDISGLRFSFSIQKGATKSPNQCTVRVWNAAPETRALIEVIGNGTRG